MMKHHPKSVYAGLVLAFALTAGTNLPAQAQVQASSESQELALQLVQHAGLGKLSMLTLRAHAWAEVMKEPIDSAPNSNLDLYFSYYECLRDEDATSLETPLAKLLASNLTMQDMRELLEFYTGPVGSQASQIQLRGYLTNQKLPKTGEYSSFASLAFLSQAEQETMTLFFSSELFAKMTKPLTQDNTDFSNAVSTLVTQCAETFLPATLKTSTLPVYPLVARKAGVEGAILLRVYIDATGQAKEARVLKRWFNSRDIPEASGKKSVAEVFDEIAISYAMTSTYSPERRRGVAVGTWMNLPIRFQFQK